MTYALIDMDEVTERRGTTYLTSELLHLGAIVDVAGTEHIVCSRRKSGQTFIYRVVKL